MLAEPGGSWKATHSAMPMKSPASGTSTTHVLEPNLLETAYQGHVSPELIAKARKEAEPLLGEMTQPRWLVDSSRVASFDLGIRKELAALFDVFQRSGGRRLAIVTQNAGARMVASAVGFAARLPVKFFPERGAALKYLREG